MSDFDPVLAAELALGYYEALDLAGIAQDLIVEGFDSPSLRLLAGTPREDLRHEGQDLLERSLHELDIELPEHHDAVLTLARDTARRMLEGEVAPYDGALAILGLRDALSEDELRLEFAYQAYALEYDISTRQRRAVEKLILDGARGLLEDES